MFLEEVLIERNLFLKKVLEEVLEFLEVLIERNLFLKKVLEEVLEEDFDAMRGIRTLAV